MNEPVRNQNTDFKRSNLRAPNNNIYENNITANQHGIDLYYSSNNSIVENDIIDNYHGIYLFYSSQEFGFSSYNIISKNKIKNNLRRGIYLYDTFSNTISDNDISGNLCGIELFHSNYTTILNNNVYDNLYGIFLNDTSNRNHNNLVYHNNFINNNYQAKDNGDNTWNDDYPSCGNYWDDYIGEDNDGDGVGDIPYDISGGDNQDRYPLMEPYGMTELTISIRSGLFKFSGIIKNIGNKTAFNVQWKITVDGGIVLIGRESSGYLPRPLLAGEEMSVSSGLVFGFGRIVITVSVWADNAPLVSESIPGILILFFIMI